MMEPLEQVDDSIKSATERWGLIRNSIISRNPEVASSVNMGSYPITVKQGFLFKYRFRLNHDIAAMVVHEKIPRHREEGHYEDNLDKAASHLHSKPGDERKQDSAVMVSDHITSSKPAVPFPPDIATPTLENGSVSRKQIPYTFAIVETNKAVSFWDATKNSPGHARYTTRVAKSVSKMCFVPRYSIYAACSDEKSIRFFNPKFELLQTHKTTEHIQFLHYDPHLHQLISISSHVITIWAMKALVYRGTLTLELTLRLTTQIGLPLDQWITSTTFDTLNQYIYVFVNSNVIVYDSSTGMEVESWLRVANRQVTCVVCYHPYGFTIVGCKDGSVKVLNMANVLVHEFVSQYKPVTALAIYPYGPVVVTSAMDKSVRMYSLRTFKEVYCLQLQDKPLDMRILDESNMYITCVDSVMVWSLNHINTQFCMLNAKPIKIRAIESTGTPLRILVRSEDEVIRLVNPVSGKVLTTCLPLIEMDKVADVLYAAKSNKMFLLMENGEIWIIGADMNPCIVLDIWRPSSLVEEITVLCVVEGFKTVDAKKTALLKRDATLGTPYSETGQIHFGKIVCITSDTEQNLLVTGGEDKVVQISTFNPAADKMFKVHISIETKRVPKEVCIGYGHLCVAYEDATVHMFSFNIAGGTWKQIPNHSKSDDHVEPITSLCVNKLLGLFVTSSLDATIKVWDLQNNLVREIQFHDAIKSICFANPRGDILIDIENRIDIINYALYLPPTYIKTADALLKSVDLLQWNHNAVEEPIPMDESFNIKQNFSCSHVVPLTDAGHFDPQIDFSWLEGSKTTESDKMFQSLNFAIDSYSEAKIKTQLRLSVLQRKEQAREREVAYALLMEKLRLIMERRRKIVESAKRRMEQENLEVEKRDNILHEEFEKFQRYSEVLQIQPAYLKKSRWQRDSFYEMAPEIAKPLEEEEYDPFKITYNDDATPEIAIQAQAAKDVNPQGWLNGDEFQIVERSQDFLPLSILSELLPGTPEPIDIECALEALSETSLFDETVEPQTLTPTTPTTTTDAIQDLPIDPPRHDSLIKLINLIIAPDGVLPNSVLGETVEAWREAHPNLKSGINFKEAVHFIVRQKKARNKSILPVETVVEDEAAKKEAFKAKIQEMLKKKLDEEKAAEEKAEAERKAAEEAGEVQSTGDSNPELHSHVTSRGRNTLSRPPVMTPLKPRAEKYPKIIEQVLTYSWFPQDEIFYPQIQQARSLYLQKEREKEEELRKLRIEPTPEAIMGILVESFRKETSSKIKLEIFELIKWIYEELGCRDMTALIRLFCRFLQNNPYVAMDDDEIKTLIAYMPKFGLGQFELLPTLLMNVLSPISSVNQCALSSLLQLGLIPNLHELFWPKLKELVKTHYEALQNDAMLEKQAIIDAKATAKLRLLSGQSTPGTASSHFPRRSESVMSKSTTPGANNLLEVRNTIMVWLRKGLRKFLIRTAKDDETLANLRELNESGLVDRNRTEEKDKEDLAAVALRERDGKYNKGEDVVKVAAPGASVAPGGGGAKKGGKRKSLTEAKEKMLVMPGVKKGRRTSVVVAVTRNALIVLQTPTILDFLNVINLWCVSLDLKLKREAQEYIDRMAREARLAEEARIEREKIEAMAEFMRIKDAERMAKAQLQKDKIAALRAEKEEALAAAQLALSTPKKKKYKEYTGLTHVSRCHPSRETLDS
ncbi:hypothetical protein HDU98_007659 [Podochytrium sp. JEL0797]|nr:hypothetical protein HDU98_007659 [Podochytrium sp. JEL0797]